MSTETKTPVPCEPIPMVLDDEWGDHFYAEGHIDPRLFLLGCIAYQADAVDAETAIGLIMDGRRAKPGDFLSRVEHAWYKENPENEELMTRCGPDDEGATPWTTAPTCLP